MRLKNIQSEQSDKHLAPWTFFPEEGCETKLSNKAKLMAIRYLFPTREEALRRLTIAINSYRGYPV
jgi:hypothetical protein